MNMRKNMVRVSRLAMAAVIAVPALALSVPSFAAQEANSTAKVKLEIGNSKVDPVNPLDPNQPLDPKDQDGGEILPEEAEEGLSMNYVSNIDFGTNDIVPEEVTYYSTNLEARSPFIQITDNRGANKGWKMSVRANEFSDGATNSLTGSYFTFANGTSMAAGTLGSGLEITPEQNIVIPTGGTDVDVATATNGEGRGTWILRWLDNGTDPTDTGIGSDVEVVTGGNKETQKRNTNVGLTLPAGSATAGDHTTTVVWTLTDAPSI